MPPFCGLDVARSVGVEVGKDVADAASIITYGGSGWDTTNLLIGTAGAGVRGHATNGLFGGVLCSFSSIPSGVGYLAGNWTGAGTGWRAWHNGAVLTFDTMAATYTAPTRTITSDDLNKLQLWGWQWDTARVRSYFGRAEVGGGTLAATYTISDVSAAMALGIRSNGTSPAHSGITIYGYVGGNTALTLPEIEALYDAVKAAGDVAAVPSKSAALYSVTQDRAGAAFPNGLLDKIGSANLTFTVGAASGINLETRVDMPCGW
jgi:hypothetical protein